MHTTSLLPFVGLAFMFVACDDPKPSAATCGPHGVVHGDHCDCDTGYREVDGLCVPRATDTSDTTDTADDTTDTADTTDTSDTTDTAPDTGPADTHVADVGPEPTALDLSAVHLHALALQGQGGERFWVLEAAVLPHVLSLEVYPSFGGPSTPGTVVFDATEVDYATCGTCLVLRTGCEAHGDHFHCDRTFMPEVGGSVTLAELGTREGAAFSGHIDGVVFREVTIASDYTTTPVAGGGRFSLQRWDFAATLAAEASDLECSGHGHMHDDHCHCDAGYEVDPLDPTRCVPQ